MGAATKGISEGSYAEPLYKTGIGIFDEVLKEVGIPPVFEVELTPIGFMDEIEEYVAKTAEMRAKEISAEVRAEHAGRHRDEESERERAKKPTRTRTRRPAKKDTPESEEATSA